jgi:hypothetical protein
VKTAFFDTFSGVSGDMVVGALIDAGLPLPYLRKELAKLNLDGYSISSAKVKRNSIRAISFVVKVAKNQKQRDYAEIRKLISRSKLSNPVKNMSLGIFETIAKAEAKVHGVPVDEVHFHEVGAVDSIIDIVGASIGFDKLGIDRFFSSPIPLGGGKVKVSHGVMPVPAPATLEILKGVAVTGGGSEPPIELVTPTGAAIVKSVCAKFGDMPLVKPLSAGYGAGSRQRTDGVPNVLRIVIGESPNEPETAKTSRLTVLESNIDDATPEHLAHAQSLIMGSGARDVWITPVAMKKGRRGFVFSVLCEESSAEKFRNLLFEHTPTIGIRQQAVERYELPRRIEKVKTAFGSVRVKVSVTPSGEVRCKPEFDDVSAIAKRESLSYGEVYDIVLQVFKKGGKKSS